MSVRPMRLWQPGSCIVGVGLTMMCASAAVSPAQSSNPPPGEQRLREW